MRRFSILSLMVLILAVAVGFAALRGANEWWAGGLVLATLGLLGYSILGSAHGQGRARAGWLGFLVLGGGYFLAVRALPDSESASLPTSLLLQYVQEQVAGAQTAYTISLTAPGGSAAGPMPVGISGTTGVPVSITGVLNGVRVPGQGGAPGAPSAVFYSGPPVTTWGRLLPGAADAVSFNILGHCLFALLFGWVGAIVSRRMWSRREARERGDAGRIATESNAV